MKTVNSVLGNGLGFESKLRIVVSSKLALCHETYAKVLYVVNENDSTYSVIKATDTTKPISRCNVKIIEKFRTFTREQVVEEINKMTVKLKTVTDADIRNLINNHIAELQLAIAQYDAIVYSLVKTQDLLNR